MKLSRAPIWAFPAICWRSRPLATGVAEVTARMLTVPEGVSTAGGVKMIKVADGVPARSGPASWM
jgi:hypothetical protein